MIRIFAILLIILLAGFIPGQAQVDVSGVIINEVYYDVSSSNSGNWNGGTSNISEDQFIELYNNSDTDVNLADWVVCDANTFYFKFTSGSMILPARRSIVLAKVIGTHAPPPGHLAVSITTGGNCIGTWEFSTSGDCIFLINPGPDHGVGGVDPDDEWMTFSYEGAAEAGVTSIGRIPKGIKKGHETDNKDCLGQSINRNPDITGTTWEKHLVLNSTKACSPNRKVDNVSPLPVEFLSFHAEVLPEKNQVLLSWTSDEFNSAGYGIERRELFDTTWEHRGFQPSLCNTRCIGDYTFVDLYEKGSSRFLYRLRQYDLDGNEAYSPTVSVEVGPSTLPRAVNFPNPFGSSGSAASTTNQSTTIVFHIPDAATHPMVSVDIYDPKGRFVRSLFSGNTNREVLSVLFDATGLTSGTYFCRITIGGKMFLRAMNFIR